MIKLKPVSFKRWKVATCEPLLTDRRGRVLANPSTQWQNILGIWHVHDYFTVYLKSMEGK
jgi:hypothetical protein